jgi:hypothetical protein
VSRFSNSVSMSECKFCKSKDAVCDSKKAICHTIHLRVVTI